MAVQDFHPIEFFREMGGHSPAVTLDSGESLSTWSLDAHGYDSQGRLCTPGPNPLTGPIAVKGALPGDCLEVGIERLRPNRESSWSRTRIDSNLLEPALVSRFPQLYADDVDPYTVWEIDARSGLTRPKTADTQGQTPVLPIMPMLGCIGTAPEEGQVISTETSGATGGNMDYIGVREGAVLYFPVCVPGALLYLGDGHATQSHGEIGGTGTEVSMEIQVRLQVIKHRAIGWPRGLSEAHIFTIGNARPLEQALRLATTEIFSWLADDLEMDASYVSLLLTQAAEYEVANVFDPAYSVVCKLSRALLPDKFRSGGMSPY